VQSFVVKTPHHNVLIDSCVGNHKPRPARPFGNMMNSDRFEKGLAAAGLAVDSIDYVMCTHLHVDHVGWNTRLENGRWVPTFPRAKYVMATRELAYWTQKEKDDPSGVPWITDSVLPIVEAKRAQIVKSDFALNESIQFVPTPGHTIDHYSVLVGRPGQDALITGDMIHSPIQARYPELGMRADYDSQQADKRAARCSIASAIPPRSCAWCISRRHRPGACGAGAMAINSSRDRSGYAHRPRSRRWTMVRRSRFAARGKTSFVPATRRRRTAPRLSRANGLLALVCLGRGQAHALSWRAWCTA
jgi:glyoxylase-like metal-dependent hydrolase (beta-lactamase superfamily II)